MRRDILLLGALSDGMVWRNEDEERDEQKERKPGAY